MIAHLVCVDLARVRLRLTVANELDDEPHERRERASQILRALRMGYAPDVDNATLRRLRETTAMLVGLPRAIGDESSIVLSMLGLRVIVVGHPAAACERIPVVMPKLVIAPSNLSAEDREALSERSIAVGAQLLELDPDAKTADIGAIVGDAAQAALDPRLR